MKKQYIYAAVSIFLWSTLAVSAKLLLGNYNNMQVLCISSLFAAAVMLLIIGFTGRLKLFKEYGIKDIIKLGTVGFPGIFLYHALYYGGAALLPASQSFVINYLWPVLSIVFACIILKEKMTAKKIIAVLLSFLGVSVVTSGALSQANKGGFTGAVLCMLAAISYALYTVLNKKYDYDQFFAMMINCLISFLLTAVYLMLRKEFVFPPVSELPGFIWSGVLTIAIPSVTWILALKNGNTAKISNLAYITPFLSLLWSALILKEELTINCITGLMLILSGILIQMKKENENE